jgi:hypothetical protein
VAALFDLWLSPPFQGGLLKKHEILASSFDKLRMRLRQAQDEVACFQRLSPHGELVEPWATSVFRHPASFLFSNVGSGFYADVTARLGYAAGPALFYAKGGWAFFDSVGHDQFDGRGHTPA